MWTRTTSRKKDSQTETHESKRMSLDIDNSSGTGECDTYDSHGWKVTLVALFGDLQPTTGTVERNYQMSGARGVGPTKTGHNTRTLYTTTDRLSRKTKGPMVFRSFNYPLRPGMVEEEDTPLEVYTGGPTVVCLSVHTVHGTRSGRPTLCQPRAFSTHTLPVPTGRYSVSYAPYEVRLKFQDRDFYQFQELSFIGRFVTVKVRFLSSLFLRKSH